ncbi:hypothetical protein [Nocardioides sp. CFH 31398]|uniref:hypothetical protein n=1 Tax=Nocardioides sp. CFH 31398 TaxID=2919579 RepID=UPI001F06947E|nr:hypothetical protein [Nocardioides sp. CFH 31398]MCH1868534.1 hypothetical protein [Nocardioides sp. CFH 31398]
MPRSPLASLLLALVLGLLVAPVAPASGAPSSPSASGGSPVFERFALRAPTVGRSAFSVVLVRRGSAERVRGATVRFRGTSGGRTYRAARDTGARGVARWSLPRRSARFTYLEARFRPRPSDTTYVSLGLCRRDGRWRECGAG